MPTVKFHVENKLTIDFVANKNENLLDASRRAGVTVDSPCNGSGTCGKCKVQVLKGEVVGGQSSKMTDQEIKDGYVLACCAEINGDVEVSVPDIASSFKSEMQITDLSDNEQKNIHYVRKKMLKMGMTNATRLWCECIKLPPPNLDDNIADEDRLKRYFSMTLGFSKIEVSLHVLRKFPSVFREKNFDIEVVYLVMGSTAVILDVKVPTGKVTILYGLAIDIGTTSVSACLVNMYTNEIVAKASMGNSQAKFGADVINRMIYSEKKGGLEALRTAIIDDTVNPLIEQLTVAMGIAPTDIFEICMAGNTTMTHLLLGIAPDYLRREPFIPAINNVPLMKSKDLGININEESTVYLAPSVASYVGGDITAGVFAVPVWLQEEFSMLVDLGTNGEIVFGNKDFMITCACSAGPAFEGGEISCGTRAVPGAIEELTIDAETLVAKFKTIGNKKPVGICGSGIIDLICEMKKVGIIDGLGRINKEIDNPRIYFDEYNIGYYLISSKEMDDVPRDVFISEIDIGNFIKAKGAVYSAIRTLMESTDMPLEMLEYVYVAGGIGTNIGIENAIAIGMLPDIPVDRYYYIGNSSMQGSYLALTLKEGIDKISEISQNMTYMELSVHPQYMDEFISACFIPHTNLSLFPSVK